MSTVRKNILFGISVVTFEVSSCTKFSGAAGTAYSTLPDSLAGEEGDLLTLTKNHTLHSALWAKASSPSL